ncbi:DMSO reductase [Exilibacterium tricleocarpae]|uniref:DMSO reductase n=1 Tax=Exilibacterium tricleocarpae TaxID=2591008 RepID=A0A545SRZ3_9GAMM|nr:DmsC/YnfH family molybdoenzyme membrane anchor subunit [Exilibacterium tricleocarpae]TQV67743.1 DMSO reductase [Exilibacterium tricleocarpae]
MNPAFSVLMFTVASGAGYGLMSLLVLAQLLGLAPPAGGRNLWMPAGVALGLITLGLCASTLHLANPKNAWRAFACFRTSWLSREGVLAVLYYPAAMVYLGGFWVSGTVTPWVTASGLATVFLGLATLFCTGMIYASLKTIPQWHLPLTPVNYLLLGLMSGAVLLLALVGDTWSAVRLPYLCLLLIGVAALAKLAYFIRIGKPSGSSIQTATTFTRARVRLLDQGHTADGFLNKEFIFNLDTGHLVGLRSLAVVLAFIAPSTFIGLFARTGQDAFTVVAVASMLAGLLLERWLFFAEARHVVRLYHGDQTV